MAGGHGGRRPGAGRPPKALSERKRWFQEQAVLNWTTPEQARAFWECILAEATTGNAKMAKIAADYLFGVPTQPVEISGPAGGPIRHEAHFPSESLRALAALAREELGS